MASIKHRLSLVYVFALILFTQCPTITLARNPASIEEESSPTPTPTPTHFRASGPASDSPISNSELLELSLPEIGVQRATVAAQTKGEKVANKQLEGIERKIEEFKSIITRRQEESIESSKRCLTQCQDNLEDAIDGVRISIESINDQDLEKANVDISGISTDVETCHECFIELNGGDKDISAFSDWIQGVTKECLNNLKKT